MWKLISTTLVVDKSTFILFISKFEKSFYFQLIFSVENRMDDEYNGVMRHQLIN